MLLCWSREAYIHFFSQSGQPVLWAEQHCYRPSEMKLERRTTCLSSLLGRWLGDHETAITEIAGEQLVVNTRWQHYFETVGAIHISYSYLV